MAVSNVEQACVINTYDYKPFRSGVCRGAVLPVYISGRWCNASAAGNTMRRPAQRPAAAAGPVQHHVLSAHLSLPDAELTVFSIKSTLASYSW